MNTTETEIADRLEHAGSLIHATLRLAAITGNDSTAHADRPGHNTGLCDGTPATGESLDGDMTPLWFEGEPAEHNIADPDLPGSNVRHRLISIGAAVALLLTGAAFLARAGTNTGEVQVAASDQPLIEFGVTGPATTVSDLLPAIANPPAAFGEGRRAERAGQQRTGQWISAAIARSTPDGYEQPIVVSAVRGDALYLSESTPLGIELASPRFGELTYFTDGNWSAVSTQTDPIVTVSGAADQSTLLEVLGAMASSESSTDTFVLDTNQLPDGYAVIVEPTALGEDRTPRNVLTDDFRQVSINEISDRVDPLLAAALGGGRLQTVDVGATAGWTGTYQNAEFGPLRSLIWSPEPGVVLEVSVVAETWDLNDTIALAAGITMVTPGEWELRYPD